jgi:hypothetical protein
MHLYRSLTVPNIADLLLGDSVDIGEDGGEVIFCHMLEGELPKLLIFVWIVFGVISGVFISPTVTYPDIVTSIREQKSRGFIFVIDNPGIRTVKQTVLQDDGLESLSDGGSFSLDSEHGENVAVLGHHLVRLNWVFKEFAIIHEVECRLGVDAEGTGKANYQED